MNELHMRRVGTELFSEPVQHVAVALLRRGSLRALPATVDLSRQAKREDVEAIHGALREARDDIRNLSESLVPSKAHEHCLAGTITTAVHRHERRARSPVVCDVVDPENIPFSLKTCLWRFVREALDQGSGLQAVRAECGGDRLQVEVKRSGVEPPMGHDPQGLRGFHERVEAIGGQLLVQVCPDAVSYTAPCKIDELEAPLG